jgi:hypothetical protein
LIQGFTVTRQQADAKLKRGLWLEESGIARLLDLKLRRALDLADSAQT